MQKYLPSTRLVCLSGCLAKEKNARDTFRSLLVFDCVSLIIQIPKGARFVGIPGTETEEHPRGIMVEVYWDQDENGSLCISGHSDEMPVPVHAELRRPPSLSRRASMDRGRPVGYMIDLNQVP
jgi:hypothetical protein